MQASVPSVTDEPAGRLTGQAAATGIDAAALLRRHLDGDRDAFAALVADYRRPVYSYLHRCGIGEADRDDVFQAIFLRIHRAAAQLQPGRPAHPWIFTVVANEVRSHLRRRRVRQLVFDEPAAHEPPDSAPDGERLVEARQTIAWLERELLALPLTQREVLVLACIESLPLAEVAEALELPINTVKTHLRRARLALGRKLARRRGESEGEGRR